MLCTDNVNCPVGGGGVGTRGRDLTNFEIFLSNSPGWETKVSIKSVKKAPTPGGKSNLRLT